MGNSALRLISLNIWGGHIEKPLLSFIKANQDIDIFCFQEVYHNAKAKISDEARYINLNIFSEIQELLPEHKGYFRPVVKGIYGIAMFIKSSIQVLDEGESMIHANNNYIGVGPTHCRILQHAKISYNDKIFTIINVHGLWNGMGKTDTVERIAQSSKIKDFMDSVNTSKILCGDFNLRPDTESIKVFEVCMENHIKRNDIKSTRTSLYEKSERFADYIFTSPEVVVNEFKVLEDEVSDHAPLLMEFK